MSPEAGICLMEQIAPRLKAAVPYIKPVGCGGCPGIVSGWTVHGRTSPGCQRTKRENRCQHRRWHTTRSFTSKAAGEVILRHAPMSWEVAPNWMAKPACCPWKQKWVVILKPWSQSVLGEFLTCAADDASTRAARNIDWDEFINSHDYRYGVLLKDMAEGKDVLVTVQGMGPEIFPSAGAEGKDGARAAGIHGASPPWRMHRRPPWVRRPSCGTRAFCVQGSLSKGKRLNSFRPLFFSSHFSPLTNKVICDHRSGRRFRGPSFNNNDEFCSTPSWPVQNSSLSLCRVYLDCSFRTFSVYPCFF